LKRILSLAALFALLWLPCAFAQTTTGPWEGTHNAAAQMNRLTGATTAIYMMTPPVPLASLPACAAGFEGAVARATTCGSTTLATTCSGSGTTHAEVMCNGTNWIQLGY